MKKKLVMPTKKPAPPITLAELEDPVKDYLREIGRKGGSRSSKAKTAAVRRNLEQANRRRQELFRQRQAEERAAALERKKIEAKHERKGGAT